MFYKFYYKIDVGVVEYIIGISGEKFVGYYCFARLVYVAHAYAAYFGMCVFGLAEHCINALTYGTEAEKTYFDRLFAHCCVRILFS